MPGRRRITLTREGWYYLFLMSFIVGGAAFRQINLLVVLAGLMLGPLVFNWRFVAAALRRIEVRRRLPLRICAGDPLIVELVATNKLRWLGSRGIVVRDMLQRENDASGEYSTSVEVMIPQVEAGRSERAEYQCRLRRRGRYCFGRLDISTRFPLGLVRASIYSRHEDSILVCPRLGRLTNRWMWLMGDEPSGTQRSKHRHGRIEGDYYGLREWQPGDSMRWIHWRATARLGDIAVRQFEQQRSHRRILVLDLWQSKTPSAAELSRIETAVSFLATAVVDASRRTDLHLTVAVPGVGFRQRTAVATPAFAQDVLDDLALVQGTDTSLSDVLALPANETPRGARVIVISARAPLDLDHVAVFSADEPQARENRQPVTWIEVGTEGANRLFHLADESMNATSDETRHTNFVSAGASEE